MQIIQSKSNLVEKVLRDKQGRLIRATFAVYENGGRIKARLVDFVYLNQKALKSAIFTLSGFIKTKNIPMSDIGVNLRISPYFNKETILFSGSKPRAPTL